MSVVLDHRESALIAAMEAAGQAAAEVVGLETGDILIKDEAGEPTVVLERKTVADLAASIRDGRWHDQLRRLADARDSGGLAPGVVVEGHLAPWGREGACTGSVTTSALRSAALGAAFRDGVPVLFTADASETAALVECLRRKADALRRVRGEAQEAVVNRGRLLRRSDDLTPRRLALAQLCAVPGVSPAVADLALGSHETLVSWLTSADSDPVCLAELQRSKGGKRVGRKLADRLAALLGRPI